GVRCSVSLRRGAERGATGGSACDAGGRSMPGRSMAGRAASLGRGGMIGAAPEAGPLPCPLPGWGPLPPPKRGLSLAAIVRTPYLPSRGENPDIFYAAQWGKRVTFRQTEGPAARAGPAQNG